MKNEWHRISTSATLPCRTWLPFGLALAVLTATACTPPATDEPEVVQSTSAAAEPSSDVSANRGPDIQHYLDRLAEPALWENCSEEPTSYRLLKFDTDQYVAAVRISHDSQAGAYRTATSSSPDRTKSLDGFVGDRMWRRLEAEIGYADFWNLESERNVSRFNEPSFFLEGCADGEYHWVQRRLADIWLARIVQIFMSVGRLEWLEAGK